MGIGVLESGGVPFLARGLIPLVGLVAFAVESFAGDFGLIEIASAATFGFAVNGVNSRRRDNL